MKGFSKKKVTGSVRDEMERIDEAEVLVLVGQRGCGCQWHHDGYGKAPGGGKLLLPPGWAIWQDPLKFKMQLLFNPATPLLEVHLAIILGQVHTV